MVEPGIVPLDRCVGLTSFGDAFEVPWRHAHLHARFDGGLFLEGCATVTAEVTASTQPFDHRSPDFSCYCNDLGLGRGA